MKHIQHIVISLLVCLNLFTVTAPIADTPQFSDVIENQWFYNDVTEMTSSGLLKGYPDGTFRPDYSITASEYVTIVSRAAGKNAQAPSGSHWASGNLQAALDSGWYDWDELPPTGETFDKPITRQLAVKIVMRALLPNATGDYTTQSQKIKDFSLLSGRYYETVLAAYETGVIIGDNTGTFRPTSALSRAEACTIILRAIRLTGTSPGKPDTPVVPDVPVTPDAPIHGGVSENGRLQVIGPQLCNQAGSPIVLRGMSSHGIQWYGQYCSSGAIASTAKHGANVFRIAMYTGEGGYLSDHNLKSRVEAAVASAIQNDMYVIVDWHILSDGNPMDHLSEAKEFFAEFSAKYKDTPNVIYEICNEPNGNVSWSGDVKPYSESIIETIRTNDTSAVILIGSPTWSQDIHLAAADPISGNNLMYTCHFYAGTHGEFLRQRIDDALNSGIPIFISEWGTSSADGNGGVFIEQSKTWLDFLEERGISWCNWSLCDKNETSAALIPGASVDGDWSDSDLSESGKFVFSRFNS